MQIKNNKVCIKAAEDSTNNYEQEIFPISWEKGEKALEFIFYRLITSYKFYLLLSIL